MDKQKAVTIIKKHLWTFGHSVKDVSDVPWMTYDLLVNKKVRVKVCSIEPVECVGCDVVALVEANMRFYAKNELPFKFSATPKTLITKE